MAFKSVRGTTRIYDERCYDLAVYFIGSEKRDELCADLANDIQQAVEDWFSSHESDMRALRLEQLWEQLGW